jgi:predicted PurR-regulated permease PerM
MTQKQVQAAFFFSLILVVGVISFFILRAYLVILAVALAFAILFRPIFNFFLRLKFGRGISSLMVTLIVFFVVALPLTGLAMFLGSEVASVYQKLQAFLDTAPFTGAASSPAMRWIADYAKTHVTQGGSAAIFSLISSNAISLFSGVSNALFNAFLFFISLYYFLKDGHIFRKKLFGISPLSDASEAKIYNTVLVAINAVMRGTLIIAVIQGTLAGIGFWIFNVGAPIILGGLTMFASFIPIVGTGLVLVPAIAFLFAKGSMASAIGFGIWSGIAVGLIDNMLKPKLIERRMKIHPLLILLSILGGIDMFGFLGFIIGPLVLAVTWALAEIYREEFHPHLESHFMTMGEAKTTEPLLVSSEEVDN